MAGFGDSNDIKISVSLDTEEAIKSAEQLKSALENSLKSTEAQFKKIEGLSKSMSAVLIKDIESKERIQIKALENEAAAERRRHLEALANANPEIAMAKLKYQSAAKEAQTAAQQQVAAAQRASDEKIKADQRAADNVIKLKALEVREAEAAARKQVSADSNLRTKTLENIAAINRETAKIRKTPTGGLGATAGDGKLVDAFKNSIAALSLQFGNVNVGFGSFINNFKNLGVVGGSIAGIIAAAGAIIKLDKAIDELAAQAGKVEGLSTGFQTLQRTVGQDPSKSIDALRKATQGLVSDIDLYQRANQAVLLGVPTGVFNEAAAAAVKLGRAMGIDAAFGLESLSLGLGRQSRLYLDNLGIIVSAEEAYKNFALSVGKSANDLTDAEKKAAFFAEALKKIKQRADELPEVLDTVGTSLQKLQAAQENANTKFSQGFNSSQFLITAYKEQAALAELSASASEKFGIILGTLSGITKRVANDLKAPFVLAKVAFVEFVDLFFDLRNGTEKAKDLEIALAAVQGKLQKLTDLRDKMKGEGFTLGNPRFADVDAALQKAQEEAKGLRAEIVLLRGEGEKGIKINVDNSEVIAARSQISTLFSDLKTQGERDAGIFKVPGLGDPQSAQIFSELKAAKQKFDNSLRDTAAVEKYTNALKKLEQDVSAAATKSSFADLAKDVGVFAGAISGGKIGKAKDALTGIKGGLDQLSKGAGITRVNFKALEAAIVNATKGTRKATKEAAKAFDNTRDEVEDFVRDVARITKTAIPREFEKKIADVFKKAKPGTKEFVKELENLGKEARDAGVDLKALAKSTKSFQTLAEQGVPANLIPNNDELRQQAVDYNNYLEDVRKGTLNIRDLILGKGFKDGGKQAGGGFFGFDIDESISAETEAALAVQVQDSLSIAFRAGLDGFSKEDVPAIAAGLGTILGGIAGISGGPAGVALGASIGGSLGTAVGSFISQTKEDSIGDLNNYFKDIFEPGRIAFIVNQQIQTAAGQITTQPIVNALTSPIELNTFDLIRINVADQPGESVFAGLSASLKAEFEAVAVALGTLADLTYEESIFIAKILAENTQGALQNLQVLIQATGKTLQEFADRIYEAFLNSALTIEQAYNAVVRLNNYFEEGIPGAIGAWNEAIKNAVTSFDIGGRQFVDSLRDIGSEGEEAGKSFEEVITEFGKQMNLNSEQIQLLFAALRSNGINTLEDLSKVGVNVALRFGEQLRRIKEENAQVVADIDIPKIPEPTKPSTSGRSREKSAAEIAAEKAAELLKKQTEEARRLVQDSQEYLKIIEKINAGQISNVRAGKEIKQINAEILKLIKDRDATEKKLNAELDKGTKGNAKTIAELSAALQKLEERLDKVKEKAAENKREYKDLNISAVIPLIRSQNTLGLVARQIGVDLKTNVDILVKGFLQGRMSIKQVNDEINKTKELLGPGIPNSVGAVTDAFQNLIDAGTQGGQFSADAFTDIFAEFRKKFVKEGSAFQQAQRKILNDNLDSARRALLTASGPEATEAARKALDLAKKAIEDFKNTPVAPDLSDLRDQLRNSFSPEQVDLFFQALDESGLKSFEELEGASAEAIVGILGRRGELGFKFGETSEEAKGINKGLRDAETAANAGLDPLQQAINLVTSFNNAAGLLPPVFNSTTDAIGGMEQPLAKIKDKIADTIELLGRLGGQTFTNDIVFNIRTTGEQGGKGLVDLVFGDGSDASSDTGNGKKKKNKPTKDKPSSSYTEKDFKYLSPGVYRNLKTKERVTRSEKNALIAGK